MTSVIHCVHGKILRLRFESFHSVKQFLCYGTLQNPTYLLKQQGDFGVSLGNLVKTLGRMHLHKMKVSSDNLTLPATFSDVETPLISTDPPYYDNIGYADLSDFFYIWLRRSLRWIYPELFSLMMVPKDEELIATRFRFGGDKVKAEEHFLKGLGKAFELMRHRTHPNYPMTVYYAF